MRSTIRFPVTFGLSLLMAGCGADFSVAAGLRVPPGFRIDTYAEDVPNARSMALGQRGTLFVGTRSDGRVFALRDSDGDQRADRRWTLASGLDMPNGIAFRDDALYVAATGPSATNRSPAVGFRVAQYTAAPWICWSCRTGPCWCPMITPGRSTASVTR